jgi:hypothetical protein
MIRKKFTLKIFGVGILVILLDVYNPLFISIKQLKKKKLFGISIIKNLGEVLGSFF